MSIYSPYFYIIQHTPSGKFYAGCKFAKDANPETFLKPNGYLTSSKIIQSLIERDGLESFVVISILLESEIGNVYEFETNFLLENNIAQDSNWFNCHNNILSPFGSKEFEDMMLKMHGVTHNMKLKKFVGKVQSTNLERYGVSCAMNTPENIKQRIEICKLKYGTANNFDKIKSTNLERYGTEFLFSSGTIRDKIETKIKERHGGMGNASESIKKKQSATMVERHGVDNPFKLNSFIEENRQRSIERWADPKYKEMTSKKISDARKGQFVVKCSCTICQKVVQANNLSNHYKIHK